jgi:hypothetical protein
LLLFFFLIRLWCKLCFPFSPQSAFRNILCDNSDHSRSAGKLKAGIRPHLFP